MNENQCVLFSLAALVVVIGLLVLFGAIPLQFVWLIILYFVVGVFVCYYGLLFMLWLIIMALEQIGGAITE